MNMGSCRTKLGHAALAASGNSELDGDTAVLMSPHHVLQYEQDAKGLWELAVATAKPCTDVGLLIEASNLIQNPSMAPAQQCTANGALPAGHTSQPPKVSCMELSTEPCIAGCCLSEASCARSSSGPNSPGSQSEQLGAHTSDWPFVR